MSTIPRQTLTQLANRYLEERLPDDLGVSEDDLFIRWSDDLADEFDAALDDRWLEWLELRRRGIPLGVHVVDAGDRETAGLLAESGTASRAEGERLLRERGA
jgi:hypothetical protein